MNAIFMTQQGKSAIEAAYDIATREALQKSLHFLTPIYQASVPEAPCDEWAQVDYIFSTWGMLALTEAQIRAFFPRLKAVFYAAGSVQHFARPFLACGVRIFSAYAANAVPVAEYTLAQIVLANKGFYQASRAYHQGNWQAAHDFVQHLPGNYFCKVGIIGAGMIGRLVIERLSAYRLPVLVFDPFLSDEAAGRLGVTKTDLETLFTQCQTISNHLANNAQTRNMLHYGLFSHMLPYATFINTGRGAQVVESDLVRALREVPTRTAVLDVTYPEPVEIGHPFYDLPNVVMTPHLAGSINHEIARMGQYMAQTFDSLQSDTSVQHEVSLEMLATMA